MRRSTGLRCGVQQLGCGHRRSPLVARAAGKPNSEFDGQLDAEELGSTIALIVGGHAPIMFDTGDLRKRAPRFSFQSGRGWVAVLVVVQGGTWLRDFESA